MNSLAANLIGLSDSLDIARSVVRIRRQGNGNFTVYRDLTFKDGSRGYREIAMNVKGEGAAREFARRA